MHGAHAIDIGPLRNAVARLEKSLEFCASKLAADNPDLSEQFRAAAIQAFEFTYELAHKTLRRQLASRSPTPSDVEALSFAGLIKGAGEAGLLSSDWKAWSAYRRARSITSHTYNEAAATEVLATLPTFAADIREMIQRLETVGAQ